MVHVIWTGILLGLTMAVIVGPAFFSLLQTSIHRGFRRAMYLSFGIFLSDVAFVTLCYFGISQIVTGPKHQVIFGVVAGVVLIGFGAWTFRKKPVVQSTDDDVSLKPDPPKKYMYIFKGFLLNSANPFLLIFWATTTAVVSANYGTTSVDFFIFFICALSTILATDLLKSYLANTLKKYLRPKILSFTNHALGIVMMISGIVMIVRVLL